MPDYPIYNAPLPVRKRKAKFDRKYPFEDLEVGQSFFVNIKEGKTQNNMACLSTYWSKKLNRRYWAALTDDKQWIQVWRES